MNGQAAIQRQKWLKRGFPALAVLVIYFSLFGQKLSARVAAAEVNLQRMQQQYDANQNRLQQLSKQRNDLLAELTALRQQGEKTEVETARYVGFLGGEEYAGRAIGRLNELLAQQGLRVIEDGRRDWNSAKDNIPETLFALGDPGRVPSQGGQSGASVWRIRFSGSYPSVYRMFERLSRDELMIVPVSLEMKPPDDGGDMEWILLIWI